MLSQLLWLGCKVECTVGLSEGLVCVEGERDGRLNDNWVGTTKEGVAVSVCVHGERGEREREREVYEYLCVYMLLCNIVRK